MLKTTFIKGILEDASNYGNLKFAYKPQSLMLSKEDSEKMVMIYLKDCDKDILKDLWNKLNIERIKIKVANKMLKKKYLSIVFVCIVKL
jgi:hypothetical protein